MRPLELTTSGILASLAVLIVAGVCIRLGFWQLDRRDQRLARNAVLVERMDAPPITLTRPPADTAGLTYRRARVRGRLDHARSVILAGRSHNGAPGVHVLAPVRGGGGAILVNRGWLPSPDAASADLDPLRVAGEVEVEGVLLPFPETGGEGTRPAAFRTTWFRLDGVGIRAQFPYPVAPLYLQATSRPVGDAGPDTARTFPVLLPPPAPDAGPHLSYAIQWFSFATIFLVGWLVMVLRRGDGDAAVARA
jgi:surfeit locus 1 family protein